MARGFPLSVRVSLGDKTKHAKGLQTVLERKDSQEKQRYHQAIGLANRGLPKSFYSA